MSNLSNETITFGKYKNQTLNEVLKDRQYCDWLLKQDWFSNNYEYLYNRVKSYNPLNFFIKKYSKNGNFLNDYTYFNLISVKDLNLPEKLTENEEKCYGFYLETISEIKNKIIKRLDTDNPYSIKAPVKWLQKFEDENKDIKREEFKKFLDSYGLPNITYIIEDIKKKVELNIKELNLSKLQKRILKSKNSFGKLY